MPPIVSPLKFIPATPEERDRLGWTGLDVILITGDAYIDAPHIGVAVIGRVLLNAGYRVGIIAQPDTNSAQDIARLGEPDLFWGITSGSVDAMIANYTPSGKRRKSDDMTPGGLNTRRPDRAVLVYSHLIRRYFKQTRPIVLGGIEASLRRISHYDAWSDGVRRSILFDAKADYLLYGMADQTILDLAQRLQHGRPVQTLRGLCYISRKLPETNPEFPEPDVLLPAHQEVCRSKITFTRMFASFCANADPYTAKRLLQQQDTRYLVHNPPSFPPAEEQLDAIYELPYARDVHPYDKRLGPVKALETIQFSLTTHRGCFGDCRFCAIAVHQGRQVISRSRSSIMREAAAMAKHPMFKGIIADVGGPTANMYGMGCGRSIHRGVCADKGCMFPAACRHLSADHHSQIRLLKALRTLPGIRKVFVASGVRYDLILNDQQNGRIYLEELLHHHISGQLKIAPEHIDDKLLKLMGKPGRKTLEAFVHMFEQLNARMPKKQFLTYYFMAAHPGCTKEAMYQLRSFACHRLHITPEQVQIFTPSPSTYSTLMHYTGVDPFSGQMIFVEKGLRQKMEQKAVLAMPSPKKSKTRRRTRH